MASAPPSRKFPRHPRRQRNESVNLPTPRRPERQPVANPHGRQQALAEQLGVSKGLVSLWLSRARHLSLGGIWIAIKKIIRQKPAPSLADRAHNRYERITTEVRKSKAATKLGPKAEVCEWAKNQVQMDISTSNFLLSSCQFYKYLSASGCEESAMR